MSVVSNIKENEKELLDQYRKLNDIGKKVAIERLQELAELSKYTDPVQDPESSALLSEEADKSFHKN